MTLSDDRFTVSESTGAITEPFGDTTIATLDTVGLSDDGIKSAIIDWAESEYDSGNYGIALKALALVAAENIDRIN